MKVSRLVILNVISILIFILISLEVMYTKIFFNLDLFVNSLSALMINNTLVLFSKIIDIIFDTISIILISFGISIYLWIKYSKKKSIFFIFVMLINAIVLFFIKNLFGVTRPLNALILDKSYSFPSGHTTTAIIFFGLLTALISNKKSKTFSIFSVFMILIIIFTRLYLNVHWLSDIFGGIFLGAFILTEGLILKKKWKI